MSLLSREEQKKKQQTTPIGNNLGNRPLQTPKKAPADPSTAFNQGNFQQLFQQMADHQSGMMQQLDQNSPQHGSVSVSPYNRGESKNNPLGSPTNGNPYLRTDEERLDRIRSSHAATEAERDLHSGPSPQHLRATQAVADRKQEMGLNPPAAASPESQNTQQFASPVKEQAPVQTTEQIVSDVMSGVQPDTALQGLYDDGQIGLEDFTDLQRASHEAAQTPQRRHQAIEDPTQKQGIQEMVDQPIPGFKDVLMAPDPYPNIDGIIPQIEALGSQLFGGLGDMFQNTFMGNPTNQGAQNASKKIRDLRLQQGVNKSERGQFTPPSAFRDSSTLMPPNPR